MGRACPPRRRGSQRGVPRVPGWRIGLVLLAVGLLCACATTRPPQGGSTPVARFDPSRDVFAFPNLVRAERPGLNDGFANYCLILVRGASQFFRFARFDPSASALTPADYTRLTREVLTIRPWDPPRPADARVLIPGYPDLQTFSRDQEQAVKAGLGSNILSMFDVRLWRVAVAFSGAHQTRLAHDLQDEVDAGRPVVVMITTFPHEDLLNHAVLVYEYRQETGVLEFRVYDPNDPGTPGTLYFDRTAQRFAVPPLTYSPAGPVRAFRLYTSPLF
jgi:hypothetical protein